MVKYRLDTRWPDNREFELHRIQSAPCTRRREARIFWLSFKTKVDGLSVVWPQNYGDGFFGLGLKSGNYGLVI
jgi:hypothetical protein